MLTIENLTDHDFAIIQALADCEPFNYSTSVLGQMELTPVIKAKVLTGLIFAADTVTLAILKAGL